MWCEYNKEGLKSWIFLIKIWNRCKPLTNFNLALFPNWSLEVYVVLVYQSIDIEDICSFLYGVHIDCAACESNFHSEAYTNNYILLFSIYIGLLSVCCA